VTRLPHRLLGLVGVVAVLAVAAVATGFTTGDSPTKVDFQLSWLPGGDNLGFWAALDKGYYRQEGLDVNIRSSNDPTQSIKLIASGQRKLGIAYVGDILTSASKGSPVLAVAALTNKSPFGIIALSKSGIRSAKDLKGKRVGVTSLPIDQAFFNYMLKKAGVSRSDVKIVDPGFGGIQQVIQGNLDATSAVADYEPAVLESKGIKGYRFIYYAQYGTPDAPFYAISANPGWAKDNGETIKKFIRATKRGFAWATKNPNQAAALFVKRYPDQDKKLVATIWTNESKLHGTLRNDVAKYQALANFLLREKMLDRKVNAGTLVTNTYLGKQG
jgi:ABC-type nitrate/sulfonate/bicarbonate transport system substrate-binding protein